MSDFRPAEFKAVKVSDRELLRNVIDATASSLYELRSVTIAFGLNTPQHVVEVDKYEKDVQLQELLRHDSLLAETIKFTFADGATASVRRSELAFDDVTVQPAVGTDTFRYLNFIAFLRKTLHEFNPRHAIRDYLGEETKQYYLAREASLQRLEQIATSVIQNAEQYRQESDRRLIAKEQEFKDKLESEVIALQETFSRKEAALVEREKALEERLKEVDDRASKHARRDALQRIKKRLEERNNEFKLTKGTRTLRWWTGGIAMFSLLGFGGVVLYSWIYTPPSPPTLPHEWVFFILRFIAPALGLMGTVIYLLRWTNEWFERHAREEFRLKRLDLDIDRATFIVETALEWKEEKGTEIPDQLLDRLSLNLFSEDSRASTVSHPVEELLASMKNASGDVEIRVPFGKGRFRLGREKAS